MLKYRFSSLVSLSIKVSNSFTVGALFCKVYPVFGTQKSEGTNLTCR